jgi:hypothetical protein
MVEATPTRQAPRGEAPAAPAARRDQDLVPAGNGRAARAAPPPMAPPDSGVLVAPAVTTPPAFERPSVAAAAVPDDLRRRWERTLARLRPVSSKAQGLCNSAQLLGLDGNALVLSARGSKFVMDGINDQRTRAVVEPVIAEVFGQKLGLRCDMDGRATGSLATAIADDNPNGKRDGDGSARPERVPPPESVAKGEGAPRRERAAAATRDLIAEAQQDPTVRMAMDAFGARIDSVTPDAERARPE